MSSRCPENYTELMCAFPLRHSTHGPHHWVRVGWHQSRLNEKEVKEGKKPIDIFSYECVYCLQTQQREVL